MPRMHAAARRPGLRGRLGAAILSTVTVAAATGIASVLTTAGSAGAVTIPAPACTATAGAVLRGTNSVFYQNGATPVAPSTGCTASAGADGYPYRNPNKPGTIGNAVSAQVSSLPVCDYGFPPPVTTVYPCLTGVPAMNVQTGPDAAAVNGSVFSYGISYYLLGANRCCGVTEQMIWAQDTSDVWLQCANTPNLPDNKILLDPATGRYVEYCGTDIVWSPTVKGYTVYFSIRYTVALAPNQLQTNLETWQLSVGSVSPPPIAGFSWSPAGGNIVNFNALSSISSTGPITSYQWAFGDNQTQTSATPTVAHAYAAPGQYPVTLTVTDRSGQQASITKTVSTGQSVVNSTGDGGLKAGSTACDTGGTIGAAAAPECTLRAAVALANAGGPAEIDFKINSGPAAPTIAVSTPLPEATATVTIDGTTQTGGWVEVTGTAGVGLQLSGANSKAKGLALGGFATGFDVKGPGSTISGNRIGADATGMVARSVGDGVLVNASGVTVGGPGPSAGNQIDATFFGVEGVRSPGLSVTGNLVGTDATGMALLGPSAQTGVTIVADTPAPATVAQNTIAATVMGVWVAAAGPAGTTVTGNTIGTNKAGSALLGAPTYGVRVDGTPGVGIAANTIDAQGVADVVVAGQVEAFKDTNGIVSVISPLVPPGSGAVTGGSPSIAGNTLGLLADGVTPGGHAHTGVIVWAGADSASVGTNTIAGHGSDEIDLRGGTGHTITGNNIGTDRRATRGYAGGNGVNLEGTDNVTLGGSGAAANVIGGFSFAAVIVHPLSGAAVATKTTIAGNQIGPPGPASAASLKVGNGIIATSASDTTIGPGNVIGGSAGSAITVGQRTARTTVVGNIVGLDPTATTAVPNATGISVGAFPNSTAPNSPSAVAITANTVSGNTGTGISIDAGGVNGVSVSANLIGTDGTGTRPVPNGLGFSAAVGGTDGPSKLVVGPDNVIAANTGDGLYLAADKVEVHDNRIGVARAADQALPNATGIDVGGGSPNIHDNTIAYNTTKGISVASRATATIRSNRVYGNSGLGIAGSGAPLAPALVAAARVNSPNQQTRTWLVVKGLPTDGTGTLEAFGNSSCADPEGKVPLLLKSPDLGSPNKVLTIVGNPTLLGFTVTYTASNGATSTFSTCATADTTLADMNGNGIPDVVESLGPLPGAELSRTQANVPTDTSDWVSLIANQGTNSHPVTFTMAGPAEDPGNHPAGLALPLGLIQFRVSGLDPGGSVQVDAIVPGAAAATSYWKYGPPTPGTPPAWYAFSFDKTSGTGAIRTAFRVLGTLYPGYSLQFVDGARGDSDGAANGTIVDPGGPGALAVETPPPPFSWPPTTGQVTREGGPDRVATSVVASQARWTNGASAAVLARSDTFADALTGAPLAANVHGPLLLTGSASLDPRVEAELRRTLRAGAAVYVLGGPDALNTGVADRLTGLGYTVTRIAGATRWDTAVAVADQLGDPSIILEADGTTWADAVSAGASAAHVGGAVLLTDGKHQAPVTAAYLAAHRVVTRYAVGGPAAAADPGATPLVGADRYATAVVVASRLFIQPASIGVATGADFPDALTGTADQAIAGGPLLLTPSDAIPGAVSLYLSGLSIAPAVTVYGGPSAVGPAVTDRLGRL